MLPQARTATKLKDFGFIGGVVEQTIRIPGGRTFKRDFLGCIDQIFVCGPYTLAVQSTTSANGAARLQKSIETEGLALWLAGPQRFFEVWAWRLVKRGMPRPLWLPLIYSVRSAGAGRYDIQHDVTSIAETAAKGLSEGKTLFGV